MNAPLNIEQQFVTAMAEHGLLPPAIVADGRVHRFAGPDEKRGKHSGWYVLHGDGVPAGTFGDWRTGLKENWCAKAVDAMPLADLKAYRERIEKNKAAADAERAKLAEAARQHCVKLLGRAGPVQQSHAYVEAKAITAAGAKQLGTMLLIPLRDTQGALHSLQFIQSTGEKQFKSGGIIAGCYCLIGDAPVGGAPLLICEGWATGCSLHEATGLPVAAAMSAGNLMHVAQSLRATLPDVPLILCADDDIQTKGNPGLTKAREAAFAVSAQLAVPDFGPNRQTGAADFNDLHLARGAEAVKASINAAASPRKVELAEAVPVAALSGVDSGSLSPRFEVAKDGVFYIGVRRGGKAEADIELPPVRLCDRLEMTGRGEDDAGRGYRIVRWNSRGSGTQRITAFPLATIGEREGWAMLREGGLVITTRRSDLEKLSEYLQTGGSDELHFVTESGGWTHGAYILPNGEVLGKPSTPLFYRGDKSGTSAYSPKGTIEQWRGSVARLAHGNTRPMLSLAVAFAAPLLHLVGLESGGFHLYGPSGAGKTTSAKIGASVWGSPREQVLNWDATALALANAASARNDGMMLLDEMGQGNPEAVGMAAYRLFNGTGKMQGAKDGGNREQARWRVMVLSTGEIDLAAFMNGGGKQARAGQEVRLASLPADAGKGLGAFDKLNGYPDSGQLAEAMEAAAVESHGKVGREFVVRIAAKSDEIAVRLRNAIKKSYAGLPEGASGQVRRVAARFAVAAEALEIATDEGLTGWAQGDGRAAVMTCFDCWLARFGIGNREDEKIITQAEAWFGAHAMSRFIDCFNPSQPAVHNCAGYRKGADGVPFWLVHSGAFADEIAGGFDKTAAADVLAKAGMLQKGNDGKATSKHKTPDHPAGARFYKFIKTVREDQRE
jgi:putative DNA primase/helicase